MLANFIKRTFRQLGYRLTKVDYSAPSSIRDFFSHFDKYKTLHVIDVGANKGQTIKAFLSYFQSCTIYSFEPDPDCFEQLKESYANYNSVELYQIALSDQKAKTFLFRNIKSKLSSLAPLHKSSEGRFGKARDTIEIQSIRLDDFIEMKGINRINILKIDVQGFEGRVLLGSIDAINKGIFDWIIIEVTISNVYDVENSFYLIQEILKYNYSLYSIMDLNYSDGYIISHCDFIYKKNEA